MKNIQVIPFGLHTFAIAENGIIVYTSVSGIDIGDNNSYSSLNMKYYIEYNYENEEIKDEREHKKEVYEKLVELYSENYPELFI